MTKFSNYLIAIGRKVGVIIHGFLLDYDEQEAVKLLDIFSNTYFCIYLLFSEILILHTIGVLE